LQFDHGDAPEQVLSSFLLDMRVRVQPDVIKEILKTKKENDFYMDILEQKPFSM
jgi:hypothetical protein